MLNHWQEGWLVGWGAWCEVGVGERGGPRRLGRRHDGTPMRDGNESNQLWTNDRLRTAQHGAGTNTVRPHNRRSPLCADRRRRPQIEIKAPIPSSLLSSDTGGSPPKSHGSRKPNVVGYRASVRTAIDPPDNLQFIKQKGKRKKPPPAAAASATGQRTDHTGGDDSFKLC